MTVHVVSPIQMSVCRRYVARFRLARYLAYLELSVLEGLKGRSTTNLAANVLHALNYLGDNLPAIRLLWLAASCAEGGEIFISLRAVGS